MRRGVLLVSLLVGGCGIEIEDGGRLKPLESTSITNDLRSARHLPAGAVPRTAELRDQSFETGVGREGHLTNFPVDVTAGMVTRGNERFSIYCVPCHGTEGEGDGPVVSRGFPEPESLKSPRLSAMPPGYFVHVIDQGFGRMPSYESIDGADRWAIAAFILSLQNRDATLMNEAAHDGPIVAGAKGGLPSDPPAEGRGE